MSVRAVVRGVGEELPEGHGEDLERASSARVFAPGIRLYVFVAAACLAGSVGVERLDGVAGGSGAVEGLEAAVEAGDGCLQAVGVFVQDVGQIRPRGDQAGEAGFCRAGVFPLNSRRRVEAAPVAGLG